MRRQKNLSQLKEQEKIPEKATTEIEISNLLDKDCEALVIRIKQVIKWQ